MAFSAPAAPMLQKDSALVGHEQLVMEASPGAAANRDYLGLSDDCWLELVMHFGDVAWRAEWRGRRASASR